MAIEIVVALVPTYDNSEYFAQIEKTPGCDHVMESRSFQYRCFQDAAIVNAALAVFFAFTVMTMPKNLQKMLVYSRVSIKFVLKFILTLVIALIPVAAFLNPFWRDIPVNV